MGNAFGCIQVDQSSVAIKQKWGKFEEVLEPGCHFVPWWFGKNVAGYLSLRVQQFEARCETKTKDNVFVTVVVSVQYRVLGDRASDAYYKLSDPIAQIRSYVFDVIRACVATLDLDSTFEQKQDITKVAEKELQKTMLQFGYQIVRTLILDIEPDKHVKEAMKKINAAAGMKEAAKQKAQAVKNTPIVKARIDAETKYLSGVGTARQHKAIVNGMQKSIFATSSRVPEASPKNVMNMLLINQYFDMMKDIQASSVSSSVFIPHGPGAVKDIASQIQKCLLQGESQMSTGSVSDLNNIPCFLM